MLKSLEILTYQQTVLLKIIYDFRIEISFMERIWNFQVGKVPKKLENFSGIAHSVLMSLGHFELHFWLCQPQICKTTVE